MADKPESIAQAEKCAAQGLVVRNLKAKKAEKTEIDAAVKLLLQLKLEYKEIAGVDLDQKAKKEKPKQEQKVNLEKQAAKEAKKAAKAAKKAEHKTKEKAEKGDGDADVAKKTEADDGVDNAVNNYGDHGIIKF